MWNSTSQTLSGLAVTTDDMSSLTDIYQLLQKPQVAVQTKQFLWHDLTDIIGPYFTSTESVDYHFVIARVLDIVKLFQHHGLKTSLLVCDGCVANLTAIKAIHAESGAYSILDDVTTDRFEVKPWFRNPYCPLDLIFGMICPTHWVLTDSKSDIISHFLYSLRTSLMLFFIQKEVVPNYFSMVLTKVL